MGKIPLRFSRGVFEASSVPFCLGAGEVGGELIHGLVRSFVVFEDDWILFAGAN